ncbi:FOG: Transposon-encoded proteins with TYA, reverse transcriptase, integrase domains in various combinations [Ceraceosorus bombacis]|uniref:FOG: Transposon-encoded proteins with TYA, reverse transcriptase, integrase domains in various combinations n=1 Tax=Ceraceosorus bombacis TaxID=401625 RepID=A0A0P1BA33_9BASI|nr:FOG: Transposon-encoded proteins with TYA, reverse transcriptase, integrase domains in various combinations [Ceraceosorus bombacis]
MSWLRQLGVVIDTKTGTATMGTPAPVHRIDMMKDASYCSPKSFWKQKKEKEPCYLLMVCKATNNIRLASQDVEKTAFNTRNGKWEWLVVPFGLANAPLTFQAIVNRVLSKYIGKFVIVYLDNILIFSNSVEEHREHVRLVLEALKEAKLYAKPLKCAFNVKEIDFCGHLVSDGKVRPLDDKLKVVREWPTPKTAHNVRSFVGLATYYRRFEEGFAKICAPLHDLLKGSPPSAKAEQRREVVWEQRHQDAFDHLKTRLCAAPALAQPTTEKPFFVEMDASQYAIGAVLSQETTDGKRHPVAYDGQKMKPAKLNYSVSEQELLAIKYALNAWKHYVDNGRQTTILTDHQNLETIPCTKVASKRLARWLDEFGEVNLDIKYRPGKENAAADAISRRADWVNSLNEVPSTLSELRQWFLSNATEPTQTIASEVSQWRYNPRDGKLYHQIAGSAAEDNLFAPYVEPKDRPMALWGVHGEGAHSGWRRLKDMFVSRYWWPRQLADLEAFTKACPTCQVHKSTAPNTINEHKHVIASETLRPFYQWGIDHVGPFDKSINGNRYLICAVDYATLWPIARAVPNASSKHVLRFLLKEIYPIFGPPKEIFSDNGKAFLADVVTELFLQSDTRHRIATAYHLQTNGRWRTHSTMGVSPYKVVFGMRPPVDVDHFVALPWHAMVESTTKGVSSQRHWRTVVGTNMRDYVMKRNEARQGLEGGWFGPYKIIRKGDLGTYVLESMNGLHKPVFGNHLRKITEPFGKKVWFNEAAHSHFCWAVSGHPEFAALREGGGVEEDTGDIDFDANASQPSSSSIPWIGGQPLASS